MKKTILLISTIFVSIIFSTSIDAQTFEKISKATKKGNAIFLVVTDGSEKMTEALKIANDAKQKASNIEVIKLDRQNKENTELVRKYGLSGINLPLILVMKDDVISAGFPLAQANTENLIGAIPTKKQVQVLQAFNDGKSVFVVVSRKSMIDKPVTIAQCEETVSLLNEKAVIVDLDLDDKTEASFIKSLKPDLNASRTNVFVFNGKGKFNGKLQAPVRSTQLLATANKVAKSGCCAGGSSKGCGK